MSSTVMARLGDLILYDGGDDNPNDAAWTIEVTGDDFTTGDAEPVEVIFEALLADGSTVTRTRDDNREMTIPLLISAGDSEALAEGIAVLMNHTNQRSEFGLTPPDGFGPETVFDVVTSSVTQVGDDFAWATRGELRFNLRLVCEPFGRSATQTVVAAVPSNPASPTTVTINAATTITGWSTNGATLTSQGSYLRASARSYSTIIYTSPTTLNVAATPFVSLVIWRRSANNPTFRELTAAPTMTMDGQAARLVAIRLDPTLNHARYYWQAPANTVKTFALAGPSPITELDFASLQRTDSLPGPGTPRETARAVTVNGSARTQGSFRVSHPSSALGTTLIYTWAGSGSFSPALRQYRSATNSNTATSDTATISGATEPLAAVTNFDIPVSQLIDGKHQIVVFAKRTSAAASMLYASAQVVLNGNNIGPAVNVSRAYNFGATTYRAVVIGSLPLPAIDLPDTSTAIVRVSVGSGGDSAVVLDEAWAFNLDDGDLTWVEAGTHKSVWLDTATIDHPYPALYIGDADDRSDAFSPGDLTRAWGSHEFAPPLTNAFVVTSTCQSALAEYRYYAPWHYLAPS